MSLSGVDDDSQIEARAHVANIGWQEWRSAGYVGTVGQGLAIQALELRLNGSSRINMTFTIEFIRLVMAGWVGPKTAIPLELPGLISR